MAATATGPAKQINVREGFYRPELDVLRFVAFMVVFVSHAGRLSAGRSETQWERWAHSGVFGLCLFFLLSSYLITELLLREQDKTGTVHLKAFYIRRILRIWPLYYLGVALAIISGLAGHTHVLTRAEVLYLIFFVAWKGGLLHFNPMGPLWSISCEEVFYAVWPTIAKIHGGLAILITSVAIIPISLISAVKTEVWFNPISQFLFFAFGALLALFLRRWRFSLANTARVPAGFTAFACWVYTPSREGAMGTVIHQLIVVLGCILLFLALYDCPARYLPKPLVYLGRISYGLYVFHLLFIVLFRRFVALHLPGNERPLVALFYGYLFPLAGAIGTAALSFHFFERPFLRLKARFTFVKSRD